MDQDVTWYGAIGLDLGDFVLDGDPVAPSPKGERTPKIVVVGTDIPMRPVASFTIVAKRLDG